MKTFALRYIITFSFLSISFWGFIYLLSLKHSDAGFLGILDVPGFLVASMISLFLGFFITTPPSLEFLAILGGVSSLISWNIIALILASLHYRMRLKKKLKR